MAPLWYAFVSGVVNALRPLTPFVSRHKSSAQIPSEAQGLSPKHSASHKWQHSRMQSPNCKRYRQHCIILIKLTSSSPMFHRIPPAKRKKTCTYCIFTYCRRQSCPSRAGLQASRPQTSHRQRGSQPCNAYCSAATRGRQGTRHTWSGPAASTRGKQSQHSNDCL